MANNEHEITLGVLNAVHDNSRVTQRTMAGELGIALGLTNSYLKRCIKKGLIKVQQAPANRYAYYLTPQGFSEKTRLAREYLTEGFQFFRVAREQCSSIFNDCVENDHFHIALHGLTDLAEIATLCAKDHNVNLVCIIDPSSQKEIYSGIPVFGEIPETITVDAFVITDLGNPQREFDRLARKIGGDRVYAPEILNVKTSKEEFAEGADHD